MEAPRILYTTKDVRSAIVKLFRNTKRKRVAIVAYVGDGAEAYLPSPKGIHLVCSSTPGGTNPNAIRALMRKDVKVEFADSLHMKVYWVEGAGCVLTSANLSTNALGAGGLKEAGVLLEADAVDIGHLLKSPKRRPAEPELRELDRKHKEYYKRVGWTGGSHRAASFVEWFDSPSREDWKIFFCWTASDALSDAAMREIDLDWGKAPHDWIWSREGNVQEDDWILCAWIEARRLKSLDWLFAHRTFAVPESDRNYDPGFPYEVIQVHTGKHYPPPPFAITATLRKAIDEVCRDEMAEETPTPYTLPAKSLRQVYEQMR
jgi:phosphatidylserine/phosphatidylglycerophosphate/cardiolipin synthase-like enzyme